MRNVKKTEPPMDADKRRYLENHLRLSACIGGFFFEIRAMADSLCLYFVA